MKKIGLVLGLFLLVPFFGFGQILNPVRWDFSKKDLGNNQYIVHLTAHIDPGWHVYAMDAGEGPIPTSFRFEKNENIVLKGNTRGVGKAIKKFDNAFNTELKYYENKVDFVQYVEAKKGAKSVAGTLEYMVCNDQECLPPKEVEFAVPL